MKTRVLRRSLAAPEIRYLPLPTCTRNRLGSKISTMAFLNSSGSPLAWTRSSKVLV